MFNFPPPALQIDFSFALARARELYLQDALGRTMQTLDIALVDRELARLAPKKLLAALARLGLRGELVFAVPAVLAAQPALLAYYRLLLGYSQKEFFNATTGATLFRAMEVKGVLTDKARAHLDAFCNALNQAAAILLEGVGVERVSRHLLDDLTLLTLGPQLRGGANVRRGSDATLKVFEIIHAIVKRAVRTAGANHIEVRNAARRTVLIEFAADPDIIIREQMGQGALRNIIAIEIKGGTDASNIHNRLGEAEKSHQKARANGYTECWTVVNVTQLDMALAHRESPSTDRFYRLSALEDSKNAEFQDFRQRIIALTGIRD